MNTEEAHQVLEAPVYIIALFSAVSTIVGTEVFPIYRENGEKTYNFKKHICKNAVCFYIYG